MYKHLPFIIFLIIFIELSKMHIMYNNNNNHNIILLCKTIVLKLFVFICLNSSYLVLVFLHYNDIDINIYEGIGA